MSGNTGYEHFLVPVHTITTGGTVFHTSADRIIAIKQVTGAAITIMLFDKPFTGRVLCVKDAKGDASTNNITINGNGNTIDGQNTYILSNNYASVDLFFNGIEWNIR